MRILVFGNAGSGKTTLSRLLGTEHGLAVLDLDNVVWVSSETDAFRPDTEIVADLAAFVRDHHSRLGPGEHIHATHGRAPRYVMGGHSRQGLRFRGGRIDVTWIYGS